MLAAEPGSSVAEPRVEVARLIDASMLAERPAADPRRDFEQGMSYWQPMTLGVALALVAVFGWEMAINALSSQEAIIAAGALHRESVWRGEVWRLFTMMFLHGGGEHLLGNLVALYVLGLGVEHAFSKGQWLIIYLGSGVAGALLSLAMNPGPAVGASGAIFGLMGNMMVFFYRFRGRLHFREARLGVVLAGWAAYTVIVGFMTPMVDNWAHIGGWLGGAALAFLLTPKSFD